MPLYSLLRPILFRLDPEQAHRMTVRALSLMPASRPAPVDPRLRVSLAGLDFGSPVGLAAGFDKDAEVTDAMLSFGFGFVEAGTVTPLPQPGNPRPRLFRLVEDEAVINRMGFNGGGMEKAAANLRRRRGRGGIVGINVGANKEAVDRLQDYATGIQHLGPLADYVTLNISSPNTPGLRDLQAAIQLHDLITRIAPVKAAIGKPVFLKVAPDLVGEDILVIADVLKGSPIDALIVSNTTIRRPDGLRSRHAQESGGLSGAPLRPIALTTLRAFRKALGTDMPLIGAGGIASADDAWARIRAGASLIQLYSALVYRGVGLARDIHAGLIAHLDRAGLASVQEAIGLDAEN